MNEYYFPIGIFVFIFDIFAVVNVISSSREFNVKVLWVCLVLLFPVIGFIAWLLMGPKGKA